MALVKTVAELAAIVGGEVVGDGRVVIMDVAPLSEAGSGEISFAADKKSVSLASGCRASALLVSEKAEALSAFSLIIVSDPKAAFAELIGLFRPPQAFEPGISEKAVLHEGATVGSGATVMALAVIEDGAQVGEGAIIYPGVYIGRGASVGKASILHPNVTVMGGSIIGSRVIIHANTSIGSDGFGYISGPEGHRKVPQRGIVRIEDDVEIGACVTVDRATVGETVIGEGAKLDNHIQVAHNVKIGAHSIIVDHVAIAGSTTIGQGVVIGGQAGVVGHLNIGDGAVIAAGAGVTSDVAAGEVVGGFPSIPQMKWLRIQPVYRKLPELKKQVSSLEKRLAMLEEKSLAEKD